MKYWRQFDGSAKKVGKSPSGIGQRLSRVPWRHAGRLLGGGTGRGGWIVGRMGAEVGCGCGNGGCWGQLGKTGGCGAAVGWGCGQMGKTGGGGAEVGCGWGQLGIPGGEVGWGWGQFGKTGGWGAEVGWGWGQFGKAGGWGADVGCGAKVGSCGQTKSGDGLFADGPAVVGAGNDGKVGICALAQLTKASTSNFHMI